jgi:hypothetical protein
MIKTTIALLLIVVLVSLLASCGNNESFESSAWLKGDMRARDRMCEDLVKSEILIGQTAHEAQRLLGEPDKDYDRALSYKIDLGWSLKDPKHYGLLVHLDGNAMCAKCRLLIERRVNNGDSH